MFGELWSGIVEDRNDPLYLNRVRVRIHGNYTHDKQMIATPDLPWSEVMMPATTSSLSGLGTSHHSLVEGSHVIGFFRDDKKLYPIVIGSFVGIPQDFYKIDETIDRRGNKTFTKTSRKPTDGFNDPRLEKKADYKGTPDGENPKHINRNHGLTLALDASPRRDGETIGESYPKKDYIGQSSVNKLARTTNDSGWFSYFTNETPVEDQYPVIELEDWEGPGLPADRLETGKTEGLLSIDNKQRDSETYINPAYPFNHVNESESGHIFEVDDTPEFERIHLYHRKGTRIEIQKDGDYVEKIVRDKYSVVLGNDFIDIKGDVIVNIKENAYINVGKNLTATVEEGNLKADILEGNLSVTVEEGTTDITSEEKITITGNSKTEIISDTTITGKLHVTEDVTVAKDIDAQGEITDKGATLATHKHEFTGLAEGAKGETEPPSETLLSKIIDWLNPFD